MSTAASSAFGFTYIRGALSSHAGRLLVTLKLGSYIGAISTASSSAIGFTYVTGARYSNEGRVLLTKCSHYISWKQFKRSGDSIRLVNYSKISRLVVHFI